jgi:hypothetical protein
MAALGADVSLKVYPAMEHVVCEDEIRRARRLFEAALADH